MKISSPGAITEENVPQTGGRRADRYPGTKPFIDTLLDRLRYFGRQQEGLTLFHQLLGADLLVLFGKPGLGKTSLLNARLAPLLRERDFLPLPMRFNHVDCASAPMDVFAAAIEKACQAEKIDYTPGETRNLWEFFKTAIFWRGDRLQTPVLVLDQFEEIFTLQSEEFRTAAAAEIGQLITRRLPDPLREQLKRGETLPFSEKAPEVKVLMALREDDLGMLQELTPQIPSILQNRFRLTPLSDADAAQSIVEPAQLACDEIKFSTRPFTYTPQVVEAIISEARKKSGGIDPFILQLICSHIEKQVSERQARVDTFVTVDNAYLGGNRGINMLTANFYVNAVKRLPSVTQRRHARALCEVGLLTESGRRRSMEKESLEDRFKVNESSLEILEEARLLRSEGRHGSFYYEITHDRIAEAIRDKRRWRMPREIKIGLGIFVITVLVAAGWFSNYQARKKQEAEAQREHAEQVLDVVIFDMWKRLSALGEWPLLEKIQQQLNEYYDYMGGGGESQKIQRRKSFAIDNEGDMHSRRGEQKMALDAYQRSFQIRKQLLDAAPENFERQHDLGLSYEKIGQAQNKQGDLRAALASHQKRAEITEKLIQRNPNNKEWQRDLSTSNENIGNVYFSQQELATAEKFFSKRVEAMEKLVESDRNNKDWEKDLCDGYDNIADLFFAKGEYKAALELIEKSLQIRRQFAARDPANTEWEHGISVALHGIGDVRFAQGLLSDAMDSFRSSLEIFEGLNARDPGNTEWQREIAVTLGKIGDVQLQEQDLASAIKSYSENLKMSEKLIARDPANIEWQRHLALTRQKFGDAELSKGDYRAAQKSFEACLQILEDLNARDPNNIGLQDLIAATWIRIGDALFNLEDHRGAKEAYEKSSQLLAKLAAHDPTNRQRQREIAVNYGRLGSIETDKTSALELYRKQLETARTLSAIDPDNVTWATDVAASLYLIANTLAQEDEAGKTEAVENCRQALKIMHRFAAEERLSANQKEWTVNIESLLKTLAKQSQKKR